MMIFRGTEDHFNMMGSVDIINSTLGKALGGASGGYTVGPKELIHLLRQRSRPYLFSNSCPPPVVACASKVSGSALTLQPSGMKKFFMLNSDETRIYPAHKC